MAVYTVSYVDMDSDVGGSLLAAAQSGANFTISAAQISTLQVQDDDGFLNHQSEAAETTPGIALNDPVASGDTGFEAGEEVQYYKILELFGDDGSVSQIIFLSNESGSSTQGLVAIPPFVEGVTYHTGANLANDPVAYSDLAPVTCFVKGTKIQTGQGALPIEILHVGDMVMTKDGLKPIRWIGASTRFAYGRFAPVRIEKGALGNTETLLVSPQHKLLITGGWVELLFGEPQVLVAALSLVNDHSIRQQKGGMVTYYHLLFDAHEIIFSEGLASESFFPGQQALSGVSGPAYDELIELFPELAQGDPSRFLPDYPEIKAYEGAVLSRQLTGRKSQGATGTCP